MNNVNCTTNLGLHTLHTNALKTVQFAALIAPDVSSSICWGGVVRHARHQSNKRGDLRPEFFIMPPFKIAGPGFGARGWSQCHQADHQD